MPHLYPGSRADAFWRVVLGAEPNVWQPKVPGTGAPANVSALEPNFAAYDPVAVYSRVRPALPDYFIRMQPLGPFGAQSGPNPTAYDAPWLYARRVAPMIESPFDQGFPVVVQTAFKHQATDWADDSVLVARRAWPLPLPLFGLDQQFPSVPVTPFRHQNYDFTADITLRARRWPLEVLLAMPQYTLPQPHPPTYNPFYVESRRRVSYVLRSAWV